jgi:hypothetical protein
MSTRQVYQDLVHETSASGEHRTLQWTDRRYDPTMEFETWFHGKYGRSSLTLHNP